MNCMPGHRVLHWLFVIAFVEVCIPVAASSAGTPVAGNTENPPFAVTSTPATSSTADDPSTLTATVTPVTPDPALRPGELSVSTTALPTESPSTLATWTATATPTGLSIRIESAGLAFGRIDASGSTSSSPPGLNAQTTRNGAYFVAPAAVTMVVEGDDPWQITCAASGGNELSTRLIQSGRLQWRLGGDGEWQSFAPPQQTPTCFSEPNGGGATLVLDIRLFVAMSDPPGPFLATLVFAVTSIA